MVTEVYTGEPPMEYRDCMAPDTDPTDEELEAVAKEALAIAMERRAEYERWVSAALRDAETDAHLHRLPRGSDTDTRK